MWEFLNEKKYILASGDGCHIDEKKCLAKIKASKYSNQCKATKARDKETVPLKDSPYKAEVCPMAQQIFQPVCLKVFNSILLRGWRRHREKNRDLKEKVEQQTHVNSKIKNELHIYKTLYRIEQKYNFQLKKPLMTAALNVKDARGTCETLTAGLISLKTRHSLMEQEFECKCRELDSLRLLIDRTKADLFNAICAQETLRSGLDATRQRKKLVEEKKDQTIKEACEFRLERRKIKKKYCKELEKRSKDLQESQKMREEVEAQEKAELDAAKRDIQRTVQSERTLEELRKQALLLQRIVDESLMARCIYEYYWGKFNRYKAHALELIVSATVLMLPALPPPHKLTSMLN